MSKSAARTTSKDKEKDKKKTTHTDKAKERETKEREKEKEQAVSRKRQLKQINEDNSLARMLAMSEDLDLDEELSREGDKERDTDRDTKQDDKESDNEKEPVEKKAKKAGPWTAEQHTAMLEAMLGENNAYITVVIYIICSRNGKTSNSATIKIRLRTCGVCVKG